MSQTKVQLPFLEPHEYETLMEALRFYRDNEKAVFHDKETDIKIKNKARSNYHDAANLVDKLR